MNSAASVRSRGPHSKQTASLVVNKVLANSRDDLRLRAKLTFQLSYSRQIVI